MPVVPGLVYIHIYKTKAGQGISHDQLYKCYCFKVAVY